MDSKLCDFVDPRLTHEIVDSAVEVHRRLGPGLLESVYRSCMARELDLRALNHREEVPIPIIYKGLEVAAYRADMIVENNALLELKAVEQILPLHEAQILTYLKLSKLRVGFLMNFNVTRLSLGLRRFVR